MQYPNHFQYLQLHGWQRFCLLLSQRFGWLRGMVFPLLLLFTFALGACQKVTILVERIPAGTKPNEKLYLTGNFNYWDPADANYQLVPNGKGQYLVTLPAGWGTVEYKFTRGDFTTEETNNCGDPLANRKLEIGEADTLRLEIESWKDQGLKNCEHVTMLVTPITPLKADESIFLAGDFNNWNAGEEKYRFKPIGGGLYGLTLKKTVPAIEFKFTRGDWKAEELDEYGNVIENHVFSFGTDDTLRYVIPFWKDRCRAGGDQIYVKVRIPKTTPEGQNIFVAGNFNGWNAAHPQHQLRRIAPYVFAGNFPIEDPSGRNPTEFKFTRGTWASVESETNGRNHPNRIVMHGVLDTLTLDVLAWRDLVH